jgi:hypothetical protein
MTFEQFNPLALPVQLSAHAHRQAVLRDFRDARLQAALQEVLARVTGKIEPAALVRRSDAPPAAVGPGRAWRW